MKRPCPCRRGRLVGACSNGAKIISATSPEMPGPVSVTPIEDFEPPVTGLVGRKRRGNAARVGELDGVGDEVADDLADAAGVHQHEAMSAWLQSTLSSRPLLLACGRQKSTVRLSRAERSVGEGEISSLPASILETSSRSLTMVSRPRPASIVQGDEVARFPCRARASGLRPSPGWRSGAFLTSWLMMAMKSDLALLRLAGAVATGAQRILGRLDEVDVLQRSRNADRAVLVARIARARAENQR